MFNAVDRTTGERCNTLDAYLPGHADALRARARAGELVCPGCRALLHFRSGELRRPHFAHRQLDNCRFAQASAEVCEARALLYERLRALYPGAVEMEVALPDVDPILDVRVQLPDGSSWCYWILDRSPRERELYGRPIANSQTHVIFTQKSHRPLDVPLGGIDLSPAQRELIVRGLHDDLFPPRGHLCFLDTTTGTVTTYRGLSLVHAPARFRARALRNFPLAEAIPCEHTGEILHPDNLFEFAELREERDREVAAAAIQTAPPQFPRIGNRDAAAVADTFAGAGARGWPTAMPDDRVPIAAAERGPATRVRLNAPLKCERCGVETTDWVSARPGMGLCLCRTCSAQPAQ